MHATIFLLRTYLNCTDDSTGDVYDIFNVHTFKQLQQRKQYPPKPAEGLHGEQHLSQQIGDGSAAAQNLPQNFAIGSVHAKSDLCSIPENLKLTNPLALDFTNILRSMPANVIGQSSSYSHAADSVLTIDNNSKCQSVGSHVELDLDFQASLVSTVASQENNADEVNVSVGSKRKYANRTKTTKTNKKRKTCRKLSKK